MHTSLFIRSQYSPIRRTVRSLAVWLAGIAVVVLSGCATPLPAIDRQAIASEAIPLSPQTTLGRIALKSTPSKEQSGFRLMPLGTFSYDTRIDLAHRAEVSLDVQYYHFENDASGRYLLRALRDAALRGVRVRLLIDDLYTGGNDPLFLAFAAHPNVEVRLFNPFCCARDQGQTGRFAASIGHPPGRLMRCGQVIQFSKRALRRFTPRGAFNAGMNTASVNCRADSSSAACVAGRSIWTRGRSPVCMSSANAPGRPVTRALVRFMRGDPMNPATKVLAGRL